MGSKGQSPAGQTTTSTAPLPYMYPYLGTGLQQAGQLLQQGGPNYYPGQQVASFNPLQQESFGNIQHLAGSNPYGSATAFNNNILKGNFTGPEAQLQQMGTGSMNNPELGNLLNLQNQSIQNSVNSQYAGSGRNVEQSMPVQQQQMGNADSSLMSNAYNINQGNALAANQYLGNMQQGAVGNAQNLVNSRLGLQGALGAAGNQIQGQGQNLINASENAYNFNQNQPYQNLQRYIGQIGALTPGQQQNNPYFTNPLGNMVGLGMLGSQLGGSKGSKGGGADATGGGNASTAAASGGVPYQ